MSFRHHVEFRASWGGQDWVLELWRSGVVDPWHAPSYGVLHVGVLYSTGSLSMLVEPVGYEEIWHVSHSP